MVIPAFAVQTKTTMKLFLPLTAVGLSLAVANGALLTSTYTGTKGLHELAKAQGKYMGTATDNGELSDTYYLAALKNSSEFGMLTPGNSMKWDATEATQNTFTYTKGDAIVSVAKEMGAQVRCHTLLWHQQVPSWVQSLSKTEMLSALENHITKVMTHYGDSCYAWDVANEVMGDDASYRKSFWYTTTGTDYIVTAFKTANQVKKSLGLKTKLYYNDYNTNTVNAKSTAVMNMIQTLLLDANIGIDGVGFQSHSSYSDTATTKDMVTNLERFTALGLDVAFTELDVKTSSTSPSEDEQEKQVTVYTDTVAACQQVKECVGVTIWDFDDTYTWLENAAPLPWYQPAGKGTALVRKRAYDGIAAGWGSSSSSSTASSSSGTPTQSHSSAASASVGGDADTSSGATQTTGSSASETQSTTSSSTGSEPSTTESSGYPSTTSTESSGNASPTSSGDAEPTSTTNSGNSDTTTQSSSNSDTTTQSSGNSDTTTQSSSTGATENTAGSGAQTPGAKKSCASRLRK
ncbi:putative xylanase [Phytophthora cinnamomi]|uniref:putative xylanase n=1 Tax=Phytophthora cinnamomi TaxID=4785 RepID=UPI003559A49F|nr:putative xylanase [Phytophthora cinnamomi]